MKKVILTLSIILATCVGATHAQAVFRKYGFNKKPLTLSKGKYNEFFTNDEVVQIGTVRFNTRTNKVIQLLEEDTTKTNYLSDRSSIWYSVDPLAEKFPNYSPYVYCKDNPVIYVDPDGKWPKAIHHKLIDNAFGAKSPYAKTFGRTELTLMKMGSDNADGILNGNQDDSREFIHGMKPKSMSTGDAKNAANEWIQDNVKEFVETGDFEKLGEALHTIEDETCPSHRDENGNPQEYNKPFDHAAKESPDKITKNDGKNGYISVKELAKRYKKAEIEMQKLTNSALKQRAEYIKVQEERKNISKKVLAQ